MKPFLVYFTNRVIRRMTICTVTFASTCKLPYSETLPTATTAWLNQNAITKSFTKKQILFVRSKETLKNKMTFQVYKTIECRR